MADRAAPSVKVVDTLWINVETEHFQPGAAELERQRDTNITKAYDPNGRLPSVQLV